MSQETDDSDENRPPSKDYTVMCTTRLEDTDDDSSQLCDRELTFENQVGLRRPPKKYGFEGKALAYRCPDCGNFTYICPICYEDQAPTGWFIGEMTGKKMPCHNCNYEEVVRQRRDPYSPDGGTRIDRPGIPNSLDDVPQGDHR